MQALFSVHFGFILTISLLNFLFIYGKTNKVDINMTKEKEMPVWAFVILEIFVIISYAIACMGGVNLC